MSDSRDVSHVRDRISSILRKLLASKAVVSDDTRIYHDLHIAGDDAEEMLEMIHEEFGTSFKKLEFEEFFPNDIDAFLYFWASKFGYKDKRPAFTVGRLIEAVLVGEW